MQFGFNLPNSGSLAAPEIMARIAREGEALGYDYLTVTDHVVLPDMAEPGYPYSESGAFYSTDSAYRHEMLTLAAWLAATTYAAAARARRAGRAAPAGGARREAAGDGRRAVGRAADGRDRRGLAQGRIRRRRDDAVRRARRRHRRIRRRVPHACGPRRSR